MSRRSKKTRRRGGGLSSNEAARARQLANLNRGGPPAPPGNRRHVTHGGYARVAVDRLDAKVRELVDALAEDAASAVGQQSLPAAHTVAVRMLAEALCRLEDVRANIVSFGVFDEETHAPRTAVEREAQLRREIADWLDALGMTPRSQAKLGVDLVRAHRSLEDEVAAGREAWRQHEESGAVDGTAVDDDDEAAA